MSLRLSGGASGSTRKVPDFAGDHGKALASIPGPCCFNRGIQGEQIGLKGDRIDFGDDLARSFRGLSEIIDVFDD